MAKELIAKVKEEEEVGNLCTFGDQRLFELTGNLFKREKNAQKGIANGWGELPSIMVGSGHLRPHPAASTPRRPFNTNHSNRRRQCGFSSTTSPNATNLSNSSASTASALPWRHSASPAGPWHWTVRRRPNFWSGGTNSEVVKL